MKANPQHQVIGDLKVGMGHNFPNLSSPDSCDFKQNKGKKGNTVSN